MSEGGLKAGICKYLDVSTCHITEQDSRYLGHDPHVVAYEYQYGWWVHVPDDIGELGAALLEYGYSRQLVRILRLARDEYGCNFVRFDQDGTDFDSDSTLERYDW